jgi:hypothetical protein
VVLFICTVCTVWFLGYSELAEHLVVKYGAAVEALSIKKQTPMHLAAQNGMKVLYIKTLNKHLKKG